MKCVLQEDNLRFNRPDHTCDTRKVKVLSLPEMIKEKSTFRVKALRWELVVEMSIFPLSFQVVSGKTKTSIFPLSFQVVREPLPFADH